MISKGPNKQGMDWGPKSPVIYTSITEGDPDLQQVPALGVHDKDEVSIEIDHREDQIVIDITDDKYNGQMVAIEKFGGKLRVLVWPDESGEPPYIIQLDEPEDEDEELKPFDEHEPE